LIFFFKTTGAAIASVSTELLLVLLFVIFAYKDVPIFSLTKRSLPKIIDGALIMLIVCYFITTVVASHLTPIFVSVVTIIIGGVIYGLFLLLSREEIVFEYFRFYKEKLASILHKIKGKLTRHK
jgi:hydrogenase-4 membrane subunit HyfE